MAEEIVQQNELENDPELKEMVDAGVFCGRTRLRTHPRMRPYILSTRNGVEIFHLGKTLEKMSDALEFLRAKVAAKGSVLLVGTQPAAQQILEDVSKELNIPAVTVRWLGGTLTNFKVISKRVEYLKKLRSDFATGAVEKYTKKEQLGLKKEMAQLEELFSGIENMAGRPDVVIVIDPVLHKAAMNEAKRLSIPVVAYTNSDMNPEEIEYMIPGNTKSRSSIDWFMGKVKAAIREGQKAATLETLKSN
jgi:small subunit ribosomal protein S2